jgi:hypothetical protein
VTYHVSLFWMSVSVGLLHLLLGLWCLRWTEAARSFWIASNRNASFGSVLMVLAMLGTVGLVQWTDLGEYAEHRGKMQLACLLLGGGALFLLRDLLTPRALGILLLLGAEVLLSAAFPSPLRSRLFLVGLAYGWVISGMAFVGAPYLYREGMLLLFKNAARTRYVGTVSLMGGLFLIVLAVSRFWA